MVADRVSSRSKIGDLLRRHRHTILFAFGQGVTSDPPLEKLTGRLSAQHREAGHHKENTPASQTFENRRGHIVVVLEAIIESKEQWQPT
jgi:hypothetical protein